MEKSMPSFKNEKEFERKRPSEIVREIESKDYSLLICEWGCRAFANISAVAMQHNPELLADFLDNGACEVLVNVMFKWAAESQVVSSFGCAAIHHLSWSSRDLREFLGEISACEIVVHAVSMHIGDPEISEYGSGAVGMLSKQNISNSFKLAQAGACDVMAQVGNFGFCMRHPRCENVAANVCFALSQFAEAINSTRLLECGACELITQLLKLHLNVERIAKRAVRALCSLASLNFQLRETLGQVGCCEAILTALERYDKKVVIVQEGCEALMHLALSPTNTTRIGAAGGCERIVIAMRDYLIDNYQGAEVCCGAMLSLVTYGTSAIDNRARLLDAGAVEQVKRVQFSTKASYRARENAVQLLEIMGAGAGSTASSSRTGSVTSVTAGSAAAAATATATTTGVGGSVTPGSTTTTTSSSSSSSLPSPDGSSRMRSDSFRGVVLGSEAKDGTVPLNVEVRVYESFDTVASKGLGGGSGNSSGIGSGNRNRSRTYSSSPPLDNGVLEL